MPGSPADVLADALQASGVRMGFGLPGGGPNLDVVGALDERGIRFALHHGETAACIAASTYGWLTGAPTMAVVTRGPGAASAVNGAAQATLDRQPLILVSDTVSELSRERVAHQRIDQSAMFAPVCKATGVLGRESTVGDVRDALELAAAWPPGCVHLDYDASATGSAPVDPRTAKAPIAESLDPDRVADLIAIAQHPVVIVGIGAITHAQAVRPAIEQFGAPVLTTYQAIGTIPTEHDLCAGLFTNGASERPLLEQADLIILIGMDLVEPIPTPWAIEAPVVSIAPVATTDPYLVIAAEAVGDVGGLAHAMLDGEHQWAPDAGAIHREHIRSALRSQQPTAFGPLELVSALMEATPAAATVTVDAGAHFLAIMPFWPVDQPTKLLISNGLATMGYAVPAAIGVALARPDQPVVALVGDGGLGMCVAELETIVRLELPITVIVFNDSALSLIEIKQRGEHGGPAAVRYHPTDYAAVASGYGVAATVVASADELAAALQATNWSRPALIDARIDPSVYPHLIHVTRG